jgi:hypothetical protein
MTLTHLKARCEGKFELVLREDNVLEAKEAPD